MSGFEHEMATLGFGVLAVGVPIVIFLLVERRNDRLRREYWARREAARKAAEADE